MGFIWKTVHGEICINEQIGTQFDLFVTKYAYLPYYTKWIRMFRIKCAQNMTSRIFPIWYNLATI